MDLGSYSAIHVKLQVDVDDAVPPAFMFVLLRHDKSPRD